MTISATKNWLAKDANARLWLFGVLLASFIFLSLPLCVCMPILLMNWVNCIFGFPPNFCQLTSFSFKLLGSSQRCTRTWSWKWGMRILNFTAVLTSSHETNVWVYKAIHREKKEEKKPIYFEQTFLHLLTSESFVGMRKTTTTDASALFVQILSMRNRLQNDDGSTIGARTRRISFHSSALIRFIPFGLNIAGSNC